MSKKQKPAGQGGRSGQRGSFDDGANLTAVPLKCQTRPDVFARAKEQYTVLDAWRMLGLPGEPTLGTNISPLREERRPSFSIYDGGRKFKDQGGGGEQGDDERTNTGTARSTHAEFLTPIIEGWLSSMSREDAVDTLNAIGVPCGL